MTGTQLARQVNVAWSVSTSLADIVPLPFLSFYDYKNASPIFIKILISQIHIFVFRYSLHYINNYSNILHLAFGVILTCISKRQLVSKQQTLLSNSPHYSQNLEATCKQIGTV